MCYWNSARGYDIINLVICRPERVLNALAAGGTEVYNAEKNGPNELCFTIKHSDAAAVREAAQQFVCEIRVLRIGGMTAVLETLRLRPMLFLSIAAALLLLCTASKRVLLIRTEGCDGRTEARIFELLNSEGIGLLTPLDAVDAEALGEKLRSRLGSAFTGVYKDGAALNIKYVPSAESPSAADARPAGIYADRDCIILKITAFDGRELVRRGEAVKKDQLLIDGDITPEGADRRVLIHAEGEILGETAYRFSFRIEPSHYAPVKSGVSSRIVSASLFGVGFSGINEFADSEIEEERFSMLNASFVPVRISKGLAHEIVIRLTQRQRDEMIADAADRAERAITAGIPREAVVISKETELVWADDGSLTALVNVRAIENIGYLRYIDERADTGTAAGTGE